MVIGGNLPDSDVLYTGWAGTTLDYLLHHRGHTHTIVGSLILSLLLFVAVRLWWRYRKIEPHPADIRFLAVLAILAPLLHIGLDFTNSYGVHPFWPADNHWYYGDAVFIVEPLLWACSAPLLFTLRSKVTRALVALVLVAGIGLSWFSGLVPVSLAALLTLLTLGLAAVGRFSSVRTALTSGVAAWLVVTASSWRRAGRRTPRSMPSSADSFPAARTLDTVLTPMPANPVCREVLTVQLVGDRYVARSGFHSLAPAWIPADRCAQLRLSGTPTAPLVPVAQPSTDEMAWIGELSIAATLPATLAQEYCAVDALLQFARVPWAAVARRRLGGRRPAVRPRTGARLRRGGGRPVDRRVPALPPAVGAAPRGSAGRAVSAVRARRASRYRRHRTCTGAGPASAGEECPARRRLARRVSTTSRAAVGLRSERGPVLLALMVSTGLIAIDATILATAVPSIVRDVGGFAQFPWLFSVYLLAQAVSVSVYAKLADVVGRKPIMLLGIGLFLVGSVLCGLAWSMPALIAFRAVQGLGAGAVQPMAITIAGDIYSVAERATAQGYIASVWAISSVVGPTLGGVFSEFGLWRWIFLVNVPVCLLAGVLILRNFRENVQRRKHHVDYLGRRPADQRHDPGPPRDPRRRPGLGMALAGEHRRVRRRRRPARRLRARRAARRRTGPPAVGVQPPAPRDDDVPGTGDRGDAHRARLVRADLPRERARRVTAGRRPDARRPDPRLAAVRQLVRTPVLPPAGLPPDGPDRARPRGRRHGGARPARTPAVGGPSSPSPASSPASGWASSRRRR